MTPVSATTKSGRLRLRLYLFGSFRLEHDGQTIHLPTRKIESLLAFLVLHPEPHSREKLAALLWGDVTDDQARGSLRKALTLIREHLGDEILLADRQTVQLNPGLVYWCDATAFESAANCEWQIAGAAHSDRAISDLRLAIDLYRGDLLVDFYDDWIAPERERYRGLCLETLLQLTQAMRTRTEYPSAIHLAERVLKMDAANERAHQHLMFCYQATGRRSEALQQYQECERALETELGVKPAPETHALFEWIQQIPSASPAALPTNLPIPLSSFVGRKQEIAEVKRLLLNTRALTLTGAGGCGKTRLAIQVATDLVAARLFNDGVWWIDLSSLTNASLVPQAVAKVWGLHEESDRTLVEVLTTYLRSKQLVLVLDNCEHLIDACAQLADELLKECPTLKMLMTSREALGISGEVVWRVPSLSLPDLGNLQINLPAIASCESVQLFVERAAAINPRFALTEQNASAVAQLCRQLDGIPLAIELATAFIETLSVEEILAHLKDRFALLAEGNRARLPRQQTLRATMDWSYHLLTVAEATLFGRLAVFVGGFTLQTAENVCGPSAPMHMLRLLMNLVNKSLVVADGGRSAETRYHLLETIRQYAVEKLGESGEEEQIHRRYAEFFLNLAEEANPRLTTAEQAQWLDRLDKEHDNLRAAIEWLLQCGDAEMGLRLAGALWRFWEIRGYLVEGLDRLTTLLNLPSASARPKTRLKALYAAGVLADAQSNYSLARLLFEEHLAINRELGDPWGVASSLNNLGIIALRQSDYATARSLYTQVLDIWREIKYQPNIALSLSNLGNVANLQGDFAAARASHETSLNIFRALGDQHGVAWSLNHLGDVARSQHDFETAQACYTKSLAIFRELGHKSDIANSLADLGNLACDQNDYASAQARYADSIVIYDELGDRRGVARLLESLAKLALAQRQFARALRLAGTATALREKLGAPLASLEQTNLEHGLTCARQTLGERASQSEWAQGTAMTLEQAIAHALEKP